MILKHMALTVIGMVCVPVFALAALLTVWAADRELPVALNKVWLVPSMVKACGNMDVWVTRTKAVDTGVRIERMLVDATQERHNLASIEYSANPGPLGEYTYYVGVEVPCSFEPGWAYYEGTTYYWKNPLQQYLWPIPGGSRQIPFCVFTDAVGPEQACKKVADR